MLDVVERHQRLCSPVQSSSPNNLQRKRTKHYFSVKPSATVESQETLIPLTLTVAIWVQLSSILCQTGLSRHL